jgi:hypothetical protein
MSPRGSGLDGLISVPSASTEALGALSLTQAAPRNHPPHDAVASECRLPAHPDPCYYPQYQHADNAASLQASLAASARLREAKPSPDLTAAGRHRSP